MAMLREVATYEYTDTDGSSLYEVVRFDPKTFRQRRVDGHGGHTWGLNGVRRVPYRLPEVQAGIATGRTIVIVEGEKDADALRAVKAIASTNAGGANWAWTAEFAEHFRGAARVAIIPDCDVPGRKAAWERATILAEIVPDVRIVELDDEREDGYDISDWLGGGHDVRELRTMFDATPLFVAPPVEVPKQREHRANAFVSVGDLLDEDETEGPHLVAGLLGCGSTALVVSKPKAGKTTWALNLGLAIARGTPFLGREVLQGPVLYVAMEGHRVEWKRTLRAMGATKDDAFFIAVGQAPDGALQWLHDNAKKHRPKLIVVDTFQRFTKLKDVNDYAAVTNASIPLVEIAQSTGATLLFPHHGGKSDKGDDGDNVLGSTALFGFVDTLVTIKRGVQGRRTMATRQRYGDDLEELVITLDPRTKLLQVAGARADVDRAECEAKIIAALRAASGQWLERVDLLDDIEARRATKLDALQRVVDDGRVARIGGGRKGDPHRFAAPGTPAPTTLESDSVPGFPSIYGNQKIESLECLPDKGLFRSQGVGTETSSGTESGTTNGAPLSLALADDGADS